MFTKWRALAEVCALRLNYLIHLLYSANYFSLLTYESDAQPCKFLSLLHFNKSTATFKRVILITANFKTL